MLNISALSTPSTQISEICRTSTTLDLPNITQVSNVNTEPLSSPNSRPSSPLPTLTSLINDIRNEMAHKNAMAGANEILRDNDPMIGLSNCSTISPLPTPPLQHNQNEDEANISFQLDPYSLPPIFQSPHEHMGTANTYESSEVIADSCAHFAPPPLNMSRQTSPALANELSNSTKTVLQTNDQKLSKHEQTYVTPPRKKREITVQILLAWQDNMSLAPAQRLSQEGFAINHNITLEKLSRYINAEGQFI